MENPWQAISLDDYESHMSLDSVAQLQALGEITAGQLESFPARSVMILGVAGGNGLEHIDPVRVSRVYGVDVSGEYLRRCRERYPQLAGVLECVSLDLRGDLSGLPKAELLIANLLVEYIGCECFVRAVRRASPEYVSCAVQVDEGGGFVSDSPYAAVFDGLESIHRQIDPAELTMALSGAGYASVGGSRKPLPNGKSLLRMDYCRAGAK